MSVKEQEKKKKKQEKKKDEHPAEITIEDFMKPEFVVGKIVSCEKHPDADRLLVSQIDIGTETRQIVSGIASQYSPEDMVGRQVIVVKNLKPVKLRGIESAGMILAADDGSSIALLGPDKELPAGSQVR